MKCTNKYVYFRVKTKEEKALYASVKNRIIDLTPNKRYKINPLTKVCSYDTIKDNAGYILSIFIGDYPSAHLNNAFSWIYAYTPTNIKPNTQDDKLIARVNKDYSLYNPLIHSINGANGFSECERIRIRRELRENIVEYGVKNYSNNDSNKPNIDNSFIWSNTKQGLWYWSSISNRLIEANIRSTHE